MLFNFTQNKAPTRGFTLIELLVVIAIIGMLSSVVLASLNSARGKARDARRLSDLNQLRTALELYRDTNNRYPGSTLSGSGCWWLWASGNTSGGGTFLPELVTSGAMPSVPKESFISGCTYRYVYFNTTNTACGPAGNYAVILATLEGNAPDSCRPQCTTGWGWGEPTDPKACFYILKE